MTVAVGDRILTLDTVRGVAVMGILTMNIVGFGFIDPAYFNPRAMGGTDPLNLGMYLANFVLFDGKMRGLFSFLFGASMLLVIDRATAKGESGARVHYARMLWLLVFGLAHLWLLWWGDILHHYALVGMVAYLLRGLGVRRLITVAVILIVVQTLITAFLPFGVAALQAAPPAQAAEAAKQLADFNQGFGVPSAAWIAEQVAIHRGSYAGLVEHRLSEDLYAPLAFLGFAGWETLAYMLLGMAGLKSGFLTGAWPRERYLKWLTIGLGVGIAYYSALAVYLATANFSLFATVLAVMALPTPVRPLMIIGWASLIMLAMRPGGKLTARVAAVGRMAFTNYLATSMICTTIFYGCGLGWFARLERYELYGVVVVVWALMLLWSKPWLTRFRYGPLEWLWRSLSRGRAQPLTGGAIGGD